jgi:hypothetical protein
MPGVTTALVLAGIFFRRRFFGKIALFRAGKAPLLVFTDGWSPWQPDMPSQGRAMQQHALDMEVRPGSLRVTDPVVNTAEAVLRGGSGLRYCRYEGDGIFYLNSCACVPILVNLKILSFIQYMTRVSPPMWNSLKPE